MREYPDRIHCFSRHTKISIELPIRFEEESDDAESNTAVYVDSLDDTEKRARVIARAIGLPSDAPGDAYRRVAAEAAHGLTVISSEDREIDGFPAVRHVLRYDRDGVEFIRHESYAQAANLVFALIALAPANRQDEYLTAFEHASETARFVLLP